MAPRQQRTLVAQFTIFSQFLSDLYLESWKTKESFLLASAVLRHWRFLVFNEKLMETIVASFFLAGGWFSESWIFRTRIYVSEIKCQRGKFGK